MWEEKSFVSLMWYINWLHTLKNETKQKWAEWDYYTSLAGDVDAMAVYMYISLLRDFAIATAMP